MSDIVSPRYYVYTLAYPKSMRRGAIFYIGKGSYTNYYDRIDKHEEEAKRGIKSKKCDTIRKIWESGKKVVKTKIAYFDNEQDAYIYEWGLINMTTYAETLTNIHGRYTRPGTNVCTHIGRPKTHIDVFGQHEAICLQKHIGVGTNAYIVTYHNINDLSEFCANKSVNRKMLAEVINGKTASARGYSIVENCNCNYATMTVDKRNTPKPSPIEHEKAVWEKRRGLRKRTN